MRIAITYFLLIVTFFHLALAASLAQQAVSLMDLSREDMGFRLNLGKEFPGAKATVTKDEAVTHSNKPSLKLSADFTEGGRYVDASVRVGMDIRQLSFWVKNHQEPKLTFRVVDSAGRCHQIVIESESTEGWQRINFPLDTFFANQGTPNALKSVKKYQAWGGEKGSEEEFTGPAKSIHILTGPKDDIKKREIWINDLAVVPGEAAGGSAQDVLASVDLNEIIEQDHFWGFHDGREFPGATGGVKVVKTAGPGAIDGRALQVTGDFTQGGRYVAATRKLADLGATDVEEIRLMVKSDTTDRFGVRLKDGSGQTHQRNGIKFAGDGTWQEVVLKPTEVAGGEHWGGQNDGKWHGQPVYLAINLSPRGDQKVQNLFIGQSTAQAQMPAEVGAVAYSENFDGSDQLPEGWTGKGDATVTAEGAFKGKHALELRKTEETLREPVEVRSKAFPVSGPAIEASFAAKSDLQSMDNSYQGAVAMEFLNNAGTKLGARELATLFKKNPWKQEKQQVELPDGTAQARFVFSIKKETPGSFWVDELAVAPVQGKQAEDRIERLMFTTARTGNLIYPDDPKEVDLELWAKKPLPEELRQLSLTVRDYWGAEQGAPVQVTLERSGRNKENFVYKAKADISGVPMEVGRYYELLGSIPREGREPFTNHSTMAILPEAPANAYHPMEIPFTSRNWDNRVGDYVTLTHRLGVRICGIWGVMNPDPAKVKAPQIERVAELNMGYLTGSPAKDVERMIDGWEEKWSEENLRKGVRNFFAKYGEYKPSIVNLGNEPHNKGEEVKAVVNAYRIVYTEIKKVSPDTFVVGSSAGLQEDFFKYGFGEWLDAYDFHVYESAEKVREIIEVRYPKMFEKYGFPKPIWSTELGLNSQGMARQFVAAELYRKFANFFAGGGANMSWFGLLYPDPKGVSEDSFGAAHNVFFSRYNKYSPKVDAIAYYNAVNAIGVKKYVEDKVYEGDIQSFLFREPKPDDAATAKLYQTDADNPRPGETERPSYADRALQIIHKKKGRADVFLPLPGVNEVEVVRIDGQIEQLDAGGQGITLTVKEDPVLVKYEGGGSLPETLGPPAMELVEAPESVVQGEASTLAVKLNEGQPDQVSLQAPPDWKVEKTPGQSADGKPLVRFSVLSPENSEVREADLEVALAGSGQLPRGELYLRPEVTGTVALEIEPLPVEGKEDPRIKLVVTNNSPKPQRVDWDVSLTGQKSLKEGRFSKLEGTDAYFAETPMGSLEIPGREREEIVLPIAGADLFTVYEVKAVVRDVSGRSLVAERPVAAFYGVPKADGVTLDGKLDEAVWKRAPVRRIDQRDQFFGFTKNIGERIPPDWTGPEDLSADIRYAWDDENLYIAVEVTDDKTGPKTQDGSLWKMDGIQFLVDPTRTTDRKIGKYDYQLADGKKGPQVWSSLSADAGAPTGEVTGIKMETAPGATGGAAKVYEIAVPWKWLAPFQPGPNANLGFTLIVNEDDGTGRDAFITWFGNAHSKDIDTVGDLILLP
ncbi:MAG: sugar-binding protein [Verrucomicrobiota bacterium]